MADGGISEVAIAGAAAEASAAAEAAAAAAAAGTAAAALPEVAGAGATLAGTAAAAAPEVGAGLAGTAAAAAPEVAAATAPEIAAAAAPEVAAATPAATEPIFLGATQTEPLLGPSVAAPDAAAPGTSLLSSGVDTGAMDFTLPQATSGPIDTGAWTEGSQAKGLLGQFGDWWNTASTGEKLQAGGKLLSGINSASTAAKAVSPAPSKGPSHTIQPGAVGTPRGGEQTLAAVVEQMLKQRDAYQQGQLGGVPIAYRPRGLLG